MQEGHWKISIKLLLRFGSNGKGEQRIKHTSIIFPVEGGSKLSAAHSYSVIKKFLSK